MSKEPLMMDKRTHDLSLMIASNVATCGIPIEIQEYYIQHPEKIPQALCRGLFLTLPADSKISDSFSESKPIEKFGLLVDLGIITVSAAVQLDKFMYENREKFYSVNENITDANFPNPSRILKPGDKLWVRAFQQIVKGTTTSEERMTFLKKQNAVFTGAQGASLVFEQKRDQLPKGKWYASFDEKKRLWKDADGGHRVPGVNAHTDGDFFWDLGRFEYGWRDDRALLCFCDVPSGT
jgi:hypothetical protein